MIKKRFSLKRRLLTGSTIAIVAATILAGIGIDALSGQAFRALAQSQIEDEMNVLLASIEIDANNDISIEDGPQDPRFSLANSGFYWQVGRNGKVESHSQSLWDPGLPWTGTTRSANPISELKDSNGVKLLSIERTVVILTPRGEQTVSALVALDSNEIAPLRWRFFYAMAPSLAVLMLALIAAVILFLRYGLRPLDRLNIELMALRDRTAKTISGRYPDEIQPLIDNLNALIASSEKQLLAARSRAGDLAHGLKTSLAVLDAKARILEERGQTDSAATIRDEVWRMNAHVKRTLAQARANLSAAQLSGRVNAHAALTKLVAIMKKLSVEQGINFSLECPDDVMIAMDDSDFSTIIGNLLDNARKWAQTCCLVRFKAGDQLPAMVISVEDDGPGLPANVEISFIERGKRLDEAVSGTGFGLAIVKDITEAYGGQLRIGRSRLGGLRVDIQLPGKLVTTATT